jgi:hypothetical protein
MNTFAVGDVSERANVAEEMTGTLETCPTSLGIRAITFAILLGFGTIAVAGEPVGDGSCRQKSPLVVVGCCPKSLLTDCPDDYCRKPMPRFTCLPCGQPDDYCLILSRIINRNWCSASVGIGTVRRIRAI